MGKTGFIATMRVLLLAGAMISVGAAWATPPLPGAPSDFSTGFIATGSVATIEALVSDLRSVPWQVGVEAGNLYEDHQKQRVRLDFLKADGVTPRETLFLFFQKTQQYTYVYATDTCTEAALTSTETAFFGFLSSAKFAGTLGKGAEKVDVWRTRTPKSGSVKMIDLAVLAAPPGDLVSVEWWAPLPVWMKFTNFVGGEPDASVFNLPAACGD